MAGTVGAATERQQIPPRLTPLMERDQAARFADAQIDERMPAGIFAKKYFDT
jgi:hypothetical protein